MNHQIKITERDIYKFVLSPDLLEEEKRIYLESNTDRFKNQIEYCRQLKNISGEVSDVSTLKNVVDRILSPNVIELMPQENCHELSGSKLKLAADSLKLNKKFNSCCFTDSSSNFMVKIVTTISNTLLYFFSQTPIPKVKITFHPSETSYIIQDPSKPIEILEESVIKKVTVEKI